MADVSLMKRIQASLRGPKLHGSMILYNFATGKAKLIDKDELSRDCSECDKQQRHPLVRKLVQHPQRDQVQHCCGSTIGGLRNRRLNRLDVEVALGALDARLEDLEGDDRNHSDNRAAQAVEEACKELSEKKKKENNKRGQQLGTGLSTPKKRTRSSVRTWSGSSSGGGGIYLVVNELLQDPLAGNGEHEARKEHANRDEHGPGERVAQPAVHEPALEADKRGEDDERRRHDVANSDAVDEDALRQPAALEDGLDLDKRYSGVRAAKGQRAGDQAERKEVDQRRRLGDAEGERDGRRHATKDDVYGVGDVLQDKEGAARYPHATSDEGVDDAVEAERDEARPYPPASSQQKGSRKIVLGG